MEESDNSSLSYDELATLRKKILQDLTGMVLDGVGEPAERFTLLLRVLQSGNATLGIYQKAYETALAIDDKDIKLEALMALMEEIDFTIAADEPQPDEIQSTN